VNAAAKGLLKLFDPSGKSKNKNKARGLCNWGWVGDVKKLKKTGGLLHLWRNYQFNFKLIVIKRKDK